jgi:hypothetical protein
MLILIGLFSSMFLSRKAFATGQLTSRSLILQAGTTDGGSKPGGVVKHLFGFTIATTANIGSIQFLYCDTAGGTCTTPTGLHTTSATMGSETGATGFTLVNTTDGSPYITRTAASLTSATAVTEQLLSVTNPTTTNHPFYVRITTFTSTNATTGATDIGTVAASTATQIVLTGTMPESLIFCAGGTITNTGGVPDCSTASSGAINFNQLFSPADTATATSQMAASTNAGSGYAITVNGPTLTSGSNTVAPITSAHVGVRGTSQFGLNLVANTTTTSTPAIGTAVAPAANGTNYKAEALAGFDTPDTFQFSTGGNNIADSANGGAGPSDIETYTVSYIVNANGAQAVGTYTTTLTYICTATF